MAATAAVSIPHIPVGEYLGSVYRPDVDYVDGVLEERNVGELDHATVQKMILLALTAQEDACGVYAVQEIRVQTQATRFRIPDVCLLPANRPSEQIITRPPMLCVEVLSPRDSVMRMRVRCADYLKMGVPEVWIFDPAAETAFVLRSDELVEKRTGILELGSTGVCLDIEQIFSSARKRSGTR